MWVKQSRHETDLSLKHMYPTKGDMKHSPINCNTNEKAVHEIRHRNTPCKFKRKITIHNSAGPQYLFHIPSQNELEVCFLGDDHSKKSNVTQAPKEIKGNDIYRDIQQFSLLSTVQKWRMKEIKR